jgi:hypothetical protein
MNSEPNGSPRWLPELAAFVRHTATGWRAEVVGKPANVRNGPGENDPITVGGAVSKGGAVLLRFREDGGDVPVRRVVGAD